MASLSREERRRQLLAKYPPPPLWKRILEELPYTSKNIIYTICRWLWLSPCLVHLLSIALTTLAQDP